MSLLRNLQLLFYSIKIASHFRLLVIVLYTFVIQIKRYVRSLIKLINTEILEIIYVCCLDCLRRLCCFFERAIYEKNNKGMLNEKVWIFQKGFKLPKSHFMAHEVIIYQILQGINGIFVHNIWITCWLSVDGVILNIEWSYLILHQELVTRYSSMLNISLWEQKVFLSQVYSLVYEYFSGVSFYINVLSNGSIA